MNKVFLRFLPIIFLMVLFSGLILLVKIDEPYPAVILPPFQNTSVKDSLSASNFIMFGYGGHSQNTKIEIEKLKQIDPK